MVVAPLLYKYRAFTPETETWLFRMLERREFWFPLASEVNDPFEYRCSIDPEKDFDLSVKAFALVETRINPGVSMADATAKSRDVLMRIRDRTLRQRMWELSFNTWRELAARITVCCFAATPTSVLMWSHYADRHRGVVIDVDTKGVGETYRVEYSDEIRSLSPAALVFPPIAMEEKAYETLFLRKAACWSYEDEYRILRHAPRSHAVAFPLRSIKRVIIGCEMPAERRHLLLEWMRVTTPDIAISFALPNSQGTHGLEIGDFADIA